MCGYAQPDAHHHLARRVHVLRIIEAIYRSALFSTAMPRISASFDLSRGPSSHVFSRYKRAHRISVYAQLDQARLIGRLTIPSASQAVPSHETATTAL
jgi:hypothetical protein